MDDDWLPVVTKDDEGKLLRIGVATYTHSVVVDGSESQIYDIRLDWVGQDFISDMDEPTIRIKEVTFESVEVYFVD